MVLGASSLRNRLLAVAVAAVFGGFAIPQAASAALIGVAGPNSSFGVAAAIIAAPLDVNDDAAANDAQQGFDEQQSYTTLAPIETDAAFATIAAGTRVDSHMIFLNTQDTSLNEHFDVIWTFDGEIIGVMSDHMGSLEVASSSELGAAGTAYPVAGFTARGLEGNAGGNSMNDGYLVLNPFQIRVDMRVTEPGDWIRVVTKPIPEPSTAMLLGLGLFGLAGRRRLRA